VIDNPGQRPRGLPTLGQLLNSLSLAPQRVCNMFLGKEPKLTFTESCKGLGRGQIGPSSHCCNTVPAHPSSSLCARVCTSLRCDPDHSMPMCTDHPRRFNKTKNTLTARSSEARSRRPSTWHPAPSTWHPASRRRAAGSFFWESCGARSCARRRGAWRHVGFSST
jgi:hypothetical protein